jgi:hypothetical protein
MADEGAGRPLADDEVLAEVAGGHAVTEHGRQEILAGLIVGEVHGARRYAITADGYLVAQRVIGPDEAGEWFAEGEQSESRIPAAQWIVIVGDQTAMLGRLRKHAAAMR